MQTESNIHHLWLMFLSVIQVWHLYNWFGWGSLMSWWRSIMWRIFTMFPQCVCVHVCFMFLSFKWSNSSVFGFITERFGVGWWCWLNRTVYCFSEGRTLWQEQCLNHWDCRAASFWAGWIAVTWTSIQHPVFSGRLPKTAALQFSRSISLGGDAALGDFYLSQCAVIQQERNICHPSFKCKKDCLLYSRLQNYSVTPHH